MNSSRYMWSDSFECPICTDVVKDPRALPCLHTFCIKCIEEHGKHQDYNGKRLNCPICRQPFFVSNGNYSNLPKNFYVQTMLEDRERVERKWVELEDGQRKLREEFEIQRKILSEQPWKTTCSRHPEREILMYCRTCRLFGCMVCLKSHQKHIWENIRRKVKNFLKEDPHYSRKLEDMKKLVMDDERGEIRTNELSDTIQLISVKNSMSTVIPVLEILVEEIKECKKNGQGEVKKSCSKKCYVFLAMVILFIGVGLYQSIFGELPSITCVPGKHLVSCSNGYPNSTTSCICWRSNSDGGPKCRATCTEGIENIEVVTSAIQSRSIMVQSKCSQLNHVLGCHVRPAPAWPPDHSRNSYFPTDDGESCICDGLPGTLCIATCGIVDLNRYEIVKYSDYENIRVTCSPDKLVLGCGISSHAYIGSSRIEKMAMDANLHSCKCSGMDFLTCYAICGRY